MSTFKFLFVGALCVVSATVPVPSPAPGTTTTTARHELTYTRATTTTQPRVSTKLFKVPSPIPDPSPMLNPSPLSTLLLHSSVGICGGIHCSFTILTCCFDPADFPDEPSPYPDPSPSPFSDATQLPEHEPAPETTFRPLVIPCSNNCGSHSCDWYLSTHATMTCDTLENEYDCDCSGCTCVNTFEYSCLNACSGTFDTCSCEETCQSDGNCCSDFTIQCSDFDFSALGSDSSDDDGTPLALIIGVGVALLIAGAVGGFFVTRKVLMNSRIARENILLKQGNANLDTSNYSSPRTMTRAHMTSPKSEFGLL